MILNLMLLLLQISPSICIDEIFRPEEFVHKDGYMIEYQTLNSESAPNKSAHAGRYARAASEYSTDFKPNEIQDIVDYHNTVRKQTMPSASNMQYMVWNEQLAHMAQQWADNCTYKHGQPPDNITPWRSIGQNMYAGTGDPRFKSGVYATRAWYEEYEWYSREDHTCQPARVCGHYTQVVWANSNQVGCGRRFCANLEGFYRNSFYIVCNYGPVGNIVGQMPYEVGPACSQCPVDKPRCYKGLCHDCQPGDPECECTLRCKNCGTLDEGTCRCTCMDGWYGVDCGNPCEDDDWCSSANAFVCWFAAHIPKQCPKMCGVCKPAREDSTCEASEKPKARPFYCSQIPYAVSMIDNQLVIFRKGKMWRFSSEGRLLSSANGERVQRKYPGLANGFKAVYQREFDNRIVFLKGANYFVFNQSTLESGPSKLKRLGLKGYTSAAFYHRTDGKSYHFKGNRVWRFDDRSQTLDAGFPRDTHAVFPGLPPKITGAYQNRAGDLIFLKGTGYYKAKRGTKRITGGRKPFHRDMLEGC